MVHDLSFLYHSVLCLRTHSILFQQIGNGLLPYFQISTVLNAGNLALEWALTGWKSAPPLDLSHAQLTLQHNARLLVLLGFVWQTGQGPS